MKAFFTYLGVLICGIALGIIIAFVYVFKDFSPSKQPPVATAPPKEVVPREKPTVVSEPTIVQDKKWFEQKLKKQQEELSKKKQELEEQGKQESELFNQFK